MSRRLLQTLAILACVHSGNLAAQDLGPLLPAGQSSQRSPQLEQYAVEETVRKPPATTNLSATLDRMGQAEPKLRLRGAREIELYRTLAPSVALIATDTGLGSGSLITTKPVAGSASKAGLILTNAHVVGNDRQVAAIFKPQQEGDKIDPATAVPTSTRSAIRPARPGPTPKASSARFAPATNGSPGRRRSTLPTSFKPRRRSIRAIRAAP
jgi:hypothetical protein